MDTEIKETFGYLRENLSLMSLTQIDLVRNMERQYKKRKWLSDSQQRVLMEIRKYLKTDS
jgi:hypothetical protein